MVDSCSAAKPASQNEDESERFLEHQILQVKCIRIQDPPRNNYDWCPTKVVWVSHGQNTSRTKSGAGRMFVKAWGFLEA